MKMSKKLLVAAFAAITAVSSQAAITSTNQIMYITGSTGFRATVNKAMYTLWSNNLAVWDQNVAVSAAGAAADAQIFGAKTLLWTNVPCTTSAGATNIDIAVSYGGSEAGIQCVAGPVGQKLCAFYDESLITQTNSTPGIPTYIAGPSIGSTPDTNAWTTDQKPAICFSDSGQAASLFNGTTVPADGAIYKKFTTGSATSAARKVAVIAFNWYANNGFPFSDITTTTACDLYNIGTAYGTEWTNNQTVGTNIVVTATGRNIDSGTRICTMLNMHYGTTANVHQSKITASGGTMTGRTIEPAGTINGIGMSAGNNGESSGGTLAGYLTNAAALAGSFSVDSGTVGATNYAISYIALPDATAKYFGQNLQPLTYNGVQGRCYDTNIFLNTTTNPGVAASTPYVQYLDQGYTNIITGRYPFWAYEYMMINTNAGFPGNPTNTPAATNIYNVLYTNITSFSSTNIAMVGAIKLTDMQCSRSADGAAIIPGSPLLY